MDHCIFCKIASHIEPKSFTYEDEDIMVFPDTRPVKPIHLLIVPKKHYKDFVELSDSVLWNKIREIARKLISQFDLADKGFRLTINGGGAQKIDHLHIHLMGPMEKMA